MDYYICFSFYFRFGFFLRAAKSIPISALSVARQLSVVTERATYEQSTHMFMHTLWPKKYLYLWGGPSETNDELSPKRLEKPADFFVATFSNKRIVAMVLTAAEQWIVLVVQYTRIHQH